MIIPKKTSFLAIFLATIATQASQTPKKEQSLNKWTKEQLFMSQGAIHNDLLKRYTCLPIYGSDNQITECLTEIPSFTLSGPHSFIAQQKLYKKNETKKEPDVFYTMSTEPGITFQKPCIKGVSSITYR